MTEEQRAYWYERVTRAIDQNLPIRFESEGPADRATLMMRRIRKREGQKKRRSERKKLTISPAGEF